jgi:hypothetical protein
MATPLRYGAAAASGGFADPSAGVELGAGALGGPSPEAGELDDAGAGGVAAGVGGLSVTFLCLGDASGSTNGPFCPHPTSAAARHPAIQKRITFI